GGGEEYEKLGTEGGDAPHVSQLGGGGHAGSIGAGGGRAGGGGQLLVSGGGGGDGGGGEGGGGDSIGWQGLSHESHIVHEIWSLEMMVGRLLEAAGMVACEMKISVSKGQRNGLKFSIS
ncbi:hypothetical protein Ancab_019678, partial [Ancistrocladus abbreviatus]